MKKSSWYLSDEEIGYVMKKSSWYLSDEEIKKQIEVRIHGNTKHKTTIVYFRSYGVIHNGNVIDRQHDFRAVAMGHTGILDKFFIENYRRIVELAKKEYIKSML